MKTTTPEPHTPAWVEREAEASRMIAEAKAWRAAWDAGQRSIDAMDQCWVDLLRMGGTSIISMPTGSPALDELAPLAGNRLLLIATEQLGAVRANWEGPGKLRIAYEAPREGGGDDCNTGR